MEDEVVNSETDLFAIGNVDASLEKREATLNQGDPSEAPASHVWAV
jgi:hypothetical protein